MLVYIAKKLRDALRLEQILTDAGIDFGVETDEYSGGMIFKSVRAGAFFYVLPEAAEAARNLMLQKGYRPQIDAPTG